MNRALVIDADPIGRNLLRLALESYGMAVTAHPSLDALGARFDASAYGAVLLDAEQPGCPAETFAGDLRRNGWDGILVLTTETIGAWDLGTLKHDLLADAVFAKPLLRDEVELRLGKLLPTLSDAEIVPDHDAWDGALRHERKRFAREIPERVAALLDALHEARRTGARDRLARARDLAAAIAPAAERYRFAAIAEICAELSDRLARLVAGEDPAPLRPWRRLDALADVLRGVPVDRVLCQQTIDDNQVYRHAVTLLVVHPALEVLLEAARLAERHEVGLVTARTVDDALATARHRHFDLALIADDLPDGGTERMLKGLSASGHGPAVALLDQADHPVAVGPLRLRLPLDEAAFALAVGNLTGHRVETPPRVLLIEPEAALLRLATDVLRAERVDVIVAELDPLEELARHRPDLVVIDIFGPMASGFEVCRQIRSDPRWATLPVVLVSAVTGDAVRESALRVGADDLLFKPVGRGPLLSTVLTRIHRHRALVEHDPDLGVLRRAAFLDHLRAAVAAAGQACRAVTVGLLDVRDLYAVNATYGLVGGDRTLREVARTVQSVVGPRGSVGRWSGGQLAVLLLDESTGSAAALLERAADRVSARRMVLGNGTRPFRLDVRLGLACSDRTGLDADALALAAERDLRDAAQAELAVTAQGWTAS